jgi:magnesium-protoporphyrin O-methyltransferase
MTCPRCASALSAAGPFFSRFAKRHRKRYARRGFEHSQKQLLEGLSRAGFQNASLLEIGSGVGALHQHLLQQGAASAVGVDLSAPMLREAEAAAEGARLRERVTYREGDFVDLEANLADADVVILDKVICCYPDPNNLVDRSLNRTKRVYAITVPRDRLFNHLGVVLLGFFLWLLRSPFRSFVHDPQAIEARIKAHHFKKTYENQTFIWLTRVYVRTH